MIPQPKPLEELIQEKWIFTENYAQGCPILAKDCERIIYDRNKKAIINRYSVYPYGEFTK